MAKRTKLSEDTLVKKLRELCNSNGREKCPAESAKTLHLIGLEYRDRSSDKVSLIQSAALLNAARVRRPENEKNVVNDLRGLCSTILQKAKAKNRQEELLAVAESVKKEVEIMRKEVKEKLENITVISEEALTENLKELEAKKIEQTESIQEYITSTYTSIMHNLSVQCRGIIGAPPNNSQYALLGMGSLARMEVTPFSDFESIIVLEEKVKELSASSFEKMLEYFRWFSIIFQVILINLGESVIPRVAIPTLNNHEKPDGDWFDDAFTPCGISFDSMKPFACKVPLGRQKHTQTKNFKTEMIKPVSEMLQYLSTEEDLKNGYHLADILKKTCFAEGSTEVYESFSGGVRNIIRQQKQDKIFLDRIKKQVEEDYDNFKIQTKVRVLYAKPYNIKSLLYRSVTIFLSAFGTIHGLEASSSFDIIRQLVERKIISEVDKHKLSYAVAIACEIRLKIYMSIGRQCDWISKRFQPVHGEQAAIVKAVGGKSVTDYFTIISQFQQSILPFENMCKEKSLDLRWHEDNFTTAEIAWILRLPNLCLKATINCLKEMINVRDYDYDKFHLYFLVLQSLDQKVVERDCFQQMQKELDLRRTISTQPALSKETAHCLYKKGFLLLQLHRHEEALATFHRQLKIQKLVSADDTSDVDVAGAYFQIGMCLKEMKKYEHAQENFRESLDIRKRFSTNINKDFDFANVSYHLGQCLRHIGKLEEAVQCFYTALSIGMRTSENEKSDYNFMDMCNSEIALCLNNTPSQSTTKV